MTETRRYPLFTPAVRGRVVRAVAIYAYNEYRVGRMAKDDYLPMFHELSADDQRRHENRARLALEIHKALPLEQPKSKRRRP